MNKPEAKLWFEVLNKKQIFNYRFLRQKPIDNYIVDFYCHKLRLAIEVDGISHADQPVYDQLRTETLLSLGIKILRYSNWQILEDVHSVANDIVENIRQRERALKINPSDQLR